MGKPTGRNGREHMSQMGNDRVSNLWQRMLQGKVATRESFRMRQVAAATAPQTQKIVSSFVFIRTLILTNESSSIRVRQP
jgi:hypothetical protein